MVVRLQCLYKKYVFLCINKISGLFFFLFSGLLRLDTEVRNFNLLQNAEVTCNLMCRQG